MQLCVIFTSSDIVDNNGELIELYCCKRFGSNITREGPPEYFFKESRQAAVNKENETHKTEQEENTELPEQVNIVVKRNRILPDDISAIRNAGVWVKDDNRPLPENIPAPIIDGESCNNTKKIVFEKFGHTGICH